MTIPPVPLGRIIENRIIELLIIFSDARLVCYRPEADFEGTDLVVTRRHKPDELRVQVKGRTYRNPGGGLHFAVPDDEIPEGDLKYVILVEYLIKRAELGTFLWVIPSTAVRELATLQGAEWEGSASTRPEANDRWVDFRYNVKDVAWVVETLIEHKAQGGAMPADGKELARVCGRRR